MFMMHRTRKKVLVCPLDWGWGHAVRMIPIISLLDQSPEIQVVLGVSGQSGQILQETFPGLKTVDMPSPRIAYSEGRSQIGKVVRQLPHFLITTIREHDRLRRLVREEDIRCVISDNRYGLFHKKVISVLVIHQVRLKLPRKLKVLELLINYLQSQCFKRFDRVWIPDRQGRHSIAGDLSVPYSSNVRYHHVGLLSRFWLSKATVRSSHIDYAILVILSGPEPQRTILENMLTGQLQKLDQSVLFIRGIIDETLPAAATNILFLSRMKPVDMASAVARSGMVICRSGYSSIMDLIAAGKRALLIPTPGQPEQEYLAKTMQKKGYFFYQHQDKLDIPYALKVSGNYQPPQMNDFSPELYIQLKWLTNRLKEQESKEEHR